MLCTPTNEHRPDHRRVAVELGNKVIRTCRNISISTVTYSFHFSDHTIEVVHFCGDLAAGCSEVSLEVSDIVIPYYVRMCCGSRDQTKITVRTGRKLKVGSYCTMGAEIWEQVGRPEQGQRSAFGDLVANTVPLRIKWNTDQLGVGPGKRHDSIRILKFYTRG
jgi:hypothetical protein